MRKRKLSPSARLGLSALLLGALLPACGPRPEPAGEPRPGAGSPPGFAALAASVKEAGCEGTAKGAAAPRAASGEARHDVVVYVAHPDDEAMYAGGTLARLRDSGRRAAVVAMSHGEGGRLLERGANGERVERRDLPRSEVTKVRDLEFSGAAGVVGAESAHLYPAEVNADFAWTTSCDEALAHWDENLPGGLAGALERLVEDIRQRRPRVVLTLDPRDDPQKSAHGHHKAFGALVELAARAAADPRFGTPSPPHAAFEVLSFAPKGAPADVEIPVDPAARLAMLERYGSQFFPEDFDEVARRPAEHFVLRWRAGAAPPAGSVLASLLRPLPARPEKDEAPGKPEAFEPIPERRPGGFPGVPFAEVRAFAFNVPMGGRPKCMSPLAADGSLCETVQGEGVRLSPDQAKRALSLLTSPSTFGGEQSKCFLPRHGLVFYDEKGTPVAETSICFMCNAMTAKPVIPAGKAGGYALSDRGLEQMRALCRELGLPKCDAKTPDE